MTSPSPTPRRIATPSWLDLRLVVGAALVLGSILLGATVVSRANNTQASVTATHDLAAGTILRADDLRIRQVRLPDSGDGVYLGEIDDAVGKTLARPVAKNELLPAGAVRTVSARTTLTVPFAAGAAPDLRTGQRIQVWVSTPRCAYVVLLSDVTVQTVRRQDRGSFSNGAAGQNVVISIEPALVPRVAAALAIDNAQIRAGVLVGAQPPPPGLSPPSSRPSASSPPEPGSSGVGQPADLAACAAAPTGR
ncbi:MAG: SAF domain-containing protein [Jatrophihabitans sp.]